MSNTCFNGMMIDDKKWKIRASIDYDLRLFAFLASLKLHKALATLKTPALLFRFIY